MTECISGSPGVEKELLRHHSPDLGEADVASNFPPAESFVQLRVMQVACFRD